MKEHKKIIVDISRNNKGEISCGMQIDALLAKNELYAGIQSIAMGSMISGYLLVFIFKHKILCNNFC